MRPRCYIARSGPDRAGYGVEPSDEQRVKPGTGRAGGIKKECDLVRSAVAGLLLTLSVLLTIPAVVTGWARSELLDTDRFTATFAPLSDEPAVQQLVADQVLTAIEEKADLDGLASALESLDLPAAVEDLLGDAAATGLERVRSLIEVSVDRVMTSDSFDEVWRTVLAEAHVQTTAALASEQWNVTSLQGGTLVIELGPIIEAVKADLAGLGVPLVSAIPPIERSVPLLSGESATLARVGYNLTEALGQWLPWIVLGLAVLGIAAARERFSALARTGVGYLLMLGALPLGLWFGREVLIDRVAPAGMSAGASRAIFDVTTVDLQTAAAWLLVPAVLLTVVGWIGAATLRRRRAAQQPQEYGGYPDPYDDRYAAPHWR